MRGGYGAAHAIGSTPANRGAGRRGGDAAGHGVGASGAAIAITLFASVGPVAVVALRVVTASGFLVSTARPPSAPLRTPMVATLAGYGLVIAGMNCCFYLAIKRVPLGVAVALEMVGTIVVAIIGSRRPRDLAAAALAAPSVLVLALTHGSTGRSPPPASRSRWAPERAGAGTSCSRPSTLDGCRARRVSRWR
ncbi:MAG: hypothetical protein ACHQEA_04670 [Gaiellales bacterium]